MTAQGIEAQGSPAMFMQSYGVQLYSAGVIIHADRRPRVVDEAGVRPVVSGNVTRGERGLVRSTTSASMRRLEFIAANAACQFNTLVTLTYQGTPLEGESEPERNLRLAKTAKRDLNRFLSKMRRQLGAYLWVQEFQQRGAVHFHLMCEGSPSAERTSVAWLMATGEIESAAAREHAVKVEAIRTEGQVRSYLGQYLGKKRQKSLPAGVEGAGRWWGRSKSLKLDLKRELVTQTTEARHADTIAGKTARSFRHWLGRRLRFKLRGGMVRDWQNRFSSVAVVVLDELKRFYSLQVWGGAR